MARRRADSNQAIFGPKDSTRSRPAAMTKEGYAAFDRGRSRIGRYVGRVSSPVSDADTAEFLARWFDDPDELVKHLRATGKIAPGQQTRTP